MAANEAVINQTWRNTWVQLFSGLSGGTKVQTKAGSLQLLPSATSGVSDIISVHEDAIQSSQSIIPLKGMFADDSSWDDLPDFLENYWQEIDATVEKD